MEYEYLLKTVYPNREMFANKEHLLHIRAVFQKLREFGLHVKLGKCRFLCKEIEFLGYILSFNDISISKEHIAMILD